MALAHPFKSPLQRVTAVDIGDAQTLPLSAKMHREPANKPCDCGTRVVAVRAVKPTCLQLPAAAR